MVCSLVHLLASPPDEELWEDQSLELLGCQSTQPGVPELTKQRVRMENKIGRSCAGRICNVAPQSRYSLSLKGPPVHLEKDPERMAASYLQISGRSMFCGFSHPESLLGQESRIILICIWSLPSFQGGAPLTPTCHHRGVMPLNQPSPGSFHVVFGMCVVTRTQEDSAGPSLPPSLNPHCHQSCHKQGGVGRHVALSE